MTRVKWIQPGEGVRYPLRFKTRLRGWWEGYDLSVLKEQLREDAIKTIQEEMSTLAQIPNEVNDEPLDQFGKPLWTADRMIVAEQLWGPSFLSPSTPELITFLLKPFGIDPSMSILHFGAGLGGATRAIAKEYKAWVTGMESSLLLSKEANQRSDNAGMGKQAPVLHLDLNQPKFPYRYDGIFAQEAFLHVENKDDVLHSVCTTLKERGQLLFTEYCCENEHDLQRPEIEKWRSKEKTKPLITTVKHITQIMKKAKLDVRIHEDMTTMQQKLILHALANFMQHLDAHSMKTSTKLAVLEEVELWAHRMEAMKNGLKLYRFYAMRH